MKSHAIPFKDMISRSNFDHRILLVKEKSEFVCSSFQCGFYSSYSTVWLYRIVCVKSKLFCFAKKITSGFSLWKVNSFLNLLVNLRSSILSTATKIYVRWRDNDESRKVNQIFFLLNFVWRYALYIHKYSDSLKNVF